MPLRWFNVKDEEVVMPEDATLLYESPEQFPCPIDSDEAKEVLSASPRALRARYACWVNDIKMSKVALLCIKCPDSNGRVKLSPLPQTHLRRFLNDVAFDWKTWNDGPKAVVPNAPGADYPLFDPRFVAAALKIPTKGDWVKAKKAEPKEAAPASTPAKGEKVMPDGDTVMVDSKPKPKAAAKAAAKPKAKSAAKPKAKTAAKPKAKSAAPKRGAAAAKSYTVNVSKVADEEEEWLRQSKLSEMFGAWLGGDCSKLTADDALSCASGMVVPPDAFPALCKAFTDGDVSTLRD